MVRWYDKLAQDLLIPTRNDAYICKPRSSSFSSSSSYPYAYRNVLLIKERKSMLTVKDISSSSSYILFRIKVLLTTERKNGHPLRRRHRRLVIFVFISCTIDERKNEWTKHREREGLRTKDPQTKRHKLCNRVSMLTLISVSLLYSKMSVL